MVGRWRTLSANDSGVNRSLYPSSDVTGGWYPPLEVCMSQCGARTLRGWVLPASAADRTLGNSVGAIGWPFQDGWVSGSGPLPLSGWARARTAPIS